MTRSNSLSQLRMLWTASLGPSHYVFAFVFLLRLIVLVRLGSFPSFLSSGSDMHFYDEWAKAIVHGRLTDHHAFYGLPLYPFVLAFLYRLFGYSAFVPGLFQAALDAGTAVLIYQITRRVVRDRAYSAKAANLTSLVAAAGWAFFVPAQAYSAILMPTAGIVFVFWLLVWLIMSTDSAPSPLRSLVLGLAVGVSAMAIAMILFLVPLLVYAVVMRPMRVSLPQSVLRLRGLALMMLLTGIIAGTSPCWIHNYFIARDPVFLSAHGGINLWLGNNDAATGYPRFSGLHAGQAQLLGDSIDIAEAAAGRPLKRSEVSTYWSSKARHYILNNPMAWLKLMTKKIGNFGNAFEYDDLGIIDNLRHHRILFPGPHFAVVAALSLPGLLFSLRSSPASRLVVAAIFLHLAAVLPVFVTERYRLPVVPGLVVFAAVGLSELWHDCFLHRFRRVLIYLVVLGMSAWLVSLPRLDPALWALRPYNAGRTALESGDLSRAEEQLQRARTFAPDNAEINLALGNLRLAEGDRNGASTFYSAVLRTDPMHQGALNNLGVLAFDEGKFLEAKQYFLQVVQQHPKGAKIYYLLARTELALGNIEGAGTAIAEALRREPDRPEYIELRQQIERRSN